MKNRLLFRIITTLLAILAAANLVCLFIFDYWLPGYSFPTASESSTATGGAISIRDQILSFSGTGDLSLILMDGVTAQDEAGNDITEQVSSVIKAGQSISEKTIEYQVKTDNGQLLSAERTLKLEDYKGPSIHITNNIPQLTNDELGDAVKAFRDRELFSADDGYGNDVTASVTGDFTADEGNPGTYLLTLNLTNQFNDSTSARTSFTADLSEPVLVLTTDTVTMKAGEGFDSQRYLVSARDTDGSTIPEVIVEGTVDTDTPGTYELIYKATGDYSGKSTSKTLTVIVTE